MSEYVYVEDKEDKVTTKSIIVTDLLAMSDLASHKYVRYFHSPTGYKYKNFLKDGEELVTFRRLLDESQMDTEPIPLLQKLKRITNLDLTEYLKNCLSIDTIFFNEERDLYHLYVIRDTKNNVYRVAPIHDYGSPFTVSPRPSTAFGSIQPTITFSKTEVDIYLDVNWEYLGNIGELMRTVMYHYSNNFKEDLAYGTFTSYFDF